MAVQFRVQFREGKNIIEVRGKSRPTTALPGNIFQPARKQIIVKSI